MIDFKSNWRKFVFPAALAGGLLFAFSQTPNTEKIGDRLQAVLPLAATACAFDKGEAAETVGRFVAGITTVHIFKNALPDTGINQRPDGHGNGFPSGHTFASVYGASYIVRQCSENIPVIGPVVTIAAGFTAASRVEADKHTVWQVFWGTLFALAFDRLFQSASARQRRNDQLKAIWGKCKQKLNRE